MIQSIHAQEGNWSEFEGKFICTNIDNSHKCARQLESELQLPFIERTSPSLVNIVINNDKKLILEDVLGEGEAVKSYSALEYLKEPNYLLIHIQYYEGDSFTLLDLASGEKHPFVGYPVFNSDYTALAVVSTDLEAGYNPNGIEIFAWKDREFISEYKISPKDWGAKKVRWKDAHKLELLKGTLDCLYSNEDKCVKLQLIKMNSDWLLEAKPKNLSGCAIESVINNC